MPLWHALIGAPNVTFVAAIHLARGDVHMHAQWRIQEEGAMNIVSRARSLAREREGKGRLVTYVEVQVHRNSN